MSSSYNNRRNCWQAVTAVPEWITTLGIMKKKSNEPTKTKSKMKKTIRFLSMAALAMVGLVMTGCSSEDNFADIQQPENKSNVVTMTTTVGFDEGVATTRALTSGGVKTFAAGDQIAVIYKNKSDQTVTATSNALTAVDITNEGKNATFTVTLTNPKASEAVRYIYPAAMLATTVATDAAVNADANVKYAALATQDGTLATLASTLDLAIFDGSLTSGAALPASATMTNRLAILAVTLKDNAATPAEITSTITGMTVSDGTNTYTVSRSAAAGPIYVAIRPTASAAIKITATDGTEHYTKWLTGKTYAASNGYSVSWKTFTYPVALSAVTSDYIGCVITSDGYVYAKVSDASAASKTAVAMIVYVGSSTDNDTYNHGLALALTNATEYPKGWSTAISTCSDKNTSTPIANASWMLPSRAQWTTMTDAAGSYTALRDGFSAAGGTNMQSAGYWSSTQNDGTYAWGYALYDGKWLSITKISGYYVRACLAF